MRTQKGRSERKHRLFYFSGRQESRPRRYRGSPSPPEGGE
ncbi:hypothetical protein HMPREF0653_00008 [Prevotella disiens JCM 6334 = ATCC 29426]|uniref:Uncharacterized protein n=1 Tax=Prevotella disiens JCM 6334 = ATCC 29426 TaxID=1235811 RepID=A0ABP2YAZ4_9BACT|nr:hypothetical protein HMPREF0653_00008 [Prevotella disiens JCM 6334 = ATCC 29426]